MKFVRLVRVLGSTAAADASAAALVRAKLSFADVRRWLLCLLLAASAQAQITYPGRESTAARFANVSTRGFVGSGASIMIPGLVVNGPTARTFLIRGTGNCLAEISEVK